MSKHMKRMAIPLVFLSIVLFFIASTFQRQYQDALFEMIIFPEGGSDRNSQVYRFVVQPNGVFITYTGYSIMNYAVERPRTLMWPIARRRKRVILGDDDFQRILMMLPLVLVEAYEGQWSVSGQWESILLYNGNIYDDSGPEFMKLRNEIIRLSPLMTRWHDPRLTN